MRRRFISNKNIYEYLIIEAIGTASFSFPNELQCCKDDVWETYVPNTVYTIESGKKVFIKGNLKSETQIGTFIINGKCKLSGSCMALVNEGNVNKPTNKFSFRYLFRGCDSIVEVSKNFLPATNLSMSCYEEMFSGCTSLVNAPELPATTLADSCYASMFNGCTKLNYIKMLATNISANSCLNYWVQGVASTGTFVKNKNATWNVTGINGVPSGWTIQKV